MTAPQPPPPALTALLLIVAVVMCLGAVFAGLLAVRLVDLRADVAAARRDCACCDDPAPAPPRRPR